MSVLLRSRSLRRLQLVLVLALMGLLIAPSLAVAQAGPLDSAVGSGSTGSVAFQFNVTSSPSGQNPSGMSIATAVGETFTSTKVICLSVGGNTAAFVVQLAPNSFGFTYAKALVVDNGPTGDTYGAEGFGGPSAPDCSWSLGGGTGFLPSPLISGDIAIFDAPELPTSTDQCMDGGWRSFGAFKNQGDCVSFVATGGKNPPSGS